MVLTADDVNAWCEQLLDLPLSFPPLDHCVDEIPSLDMLADLPPASRVLVRCDTNVTLAGAGCVDDDARLVTLLGTLQYGRERGWVQIIHGHLGNDGRASLRPVADHLGQLLGCPVQFVPDWMDDRCGEVHLEVDSAVGPTRARLGGDAGKRPPPRAGDEPLATAACGPLRPYWDALLGMLRRFENAWQESTSTKDSRHRIAIFPVRSCRWRWIGSRSAGMWRGSCPAPCVPRGRRRSWSSAAAKFNKLDDLEGIVQRGQVRLVLSGGRLALALLQADCAVIRTHLRDGASGRGAGRAV